MTDDIIRLEIATSLLPRMLDEYEEDSAVTEAYKMADRLIQAASPKPTPQETIYIYLSYKGHHWNIDGGDGDSICLSRIVENGKKQFEYITIPEFFNAFGKHLQGNPN
jgi:hypothetical protein